MQTADILIILHNMLEMYQNLCFPICRQSGLMQNAFDILMFLANNPEYNTAKDISNIRRIKANIVSFSVDKLVKEGHAIQQTFYAHIYDGFKDSDLQTHFQYIEQIRKNMESKTTTER